MKLIKAFEDANTELKKEGKNYVRNMLEIAIPGNKKQNLNFKPKNNIIRAYLLHSVMSS